MIWRCLKQEESDPRFNWRRCVIVNWMKITKINRIIGFAVSMNLKFEVASRHEMIVNGYERNCLQEDGERNCLINIHGCEIKKKKKKKKRIKKNARLDKFEKLKKIRVSLLFLPRYEFVRELQSRITRHVNFYESSTSLWLFHWIFIPRSRYFKKENH